MVKVRSEYKKRRWERRMENRRLVCGSGVIKNNVSGMAIAQVLDTSPSGLRVTAPYPFPVGAKVEILFEKSTVSGSVRYCERVRPTQFQVGIGEVVSGPNETSERLNIYPHLDRLTDVVR